MSLPWDVSSLPVVKTLLKQMLHADSRHRGTLADIMTELQVMLDTVLEVVKPQPTLSMGLCSLAPGWLDAVDAQPSLLDALLCLIGCPLPVDRADLAAHHADLNDQRLRKLHTHANGTITKYFPHFTVDSQQWEDACTIILYTCQSAICYMINGMLSQRGRVASDLTHIAPMARRLFDAVRRLGTPYTSEAFRVIYADNKLLKQAYTDYKTHFAVGRPVNFYQFASFTTDMERILSFTQSSRPMFLFKCSNITGFDINEYSDQKLQGRDEAEVLVLPPSYFVVKSRPYRLNSAVIVEVECQVDETNSTSYASIAARQVEQFRWCATCAKYTEFLYVALAHDPHNIEHFCSSCMESRIQDIATVSSLHVSGVTVHTSTYLHYDHLASVDGIPPPVSVIADAATMQQMSPTLRDTIQQLWLLHTDNASPIRSTTLPSQLTTLIVSHFDDQTLSFILTLTQLRNLNLSSSKHLTENGLLQLGSFQQLHHLQSLSISHCLVTDAVLRVVALLVQLRKLFLSGCVDITDAALESISHLTQLQDLHLNSCANITDVGLAHLANLTLLQKLGLFMCVKITDAGLASIVHLTQLRDLNLNSCANITDVGLAHTAQLRRLQKLGLCKCVDVTDAGLANIVYLTQLQDLNLNSCANITDAGLAHTAHLRHLQKLWLYKCVKITDAGLAHTAHLEQLQDLNLNSCANITDAGLAIIAHLKQLKDLNLSSCINITDAGLAHVAHLTQLQKLWLYRCVKITDVGLASVGHLTQLQDLNLNSCVGITNAGLAHFANLTELQDLNLNACVKITNAGLAHVANLTLLQKLWLHECVDVTDAGLESISHLTQLRDLNLGLCANISDVGLAHIANLTQLQELWLYKCVKITDAGLESISHLTQLRDLNLGLCANISDVVLAHIANLAQLQKLWLYKCVKITDVGLASVARLSYLKKLNLDGCSKVTPAARLALQKNLHQLQL